MTRVAVVTGGSRGIGASCALRFARSGWDVVIAYRSDAEAAEIVRTEIRGLGQRGLACRSDVSSEPEVIRLFEDAHQSFGRIDALINNAGIVDVSSRVEDMDLARLTRMMNVNVIGSFLCAREAVRRMSTRHGGSGGSIVNISTGATKVGSPGEYVDYAASKAAVEVLTLGLAKEVGNEGIRVNAVRPGVIVTEIHARSGRPHKPEQLAPTVPLGRSGSPDEVAAAVYWLCTEDASYVSGSIVDVTGGR